LIVVVIFFNYVSFVSQPIGLIQRLHVFSWERFRPSL